MSTATMTSKGQITVPKDVREALGLKPGSKVMFVDLGDGHYRLVAKTGELSDVAGMLHRPGQGPASVEQMDDGIAVGAAATMGSVTAGP